MAVHHVCIVVGVQIDEMGRLSVVRYPVLVHRDPLLLELLHLAHVHVVDARGAKGLTLLVMAALCAAWYIAHNLIRHVIGRVLIVGMWEFFADSL